MLYGSHAALSALPIWATALVLYVLTMGAIFFLRDRYEGVFYNVSFSAMMGDAGVLCTVLIAAGVLQRAGPPLPAWLLGGQWHMFAGVLGILFGVTWFMRDRPKQKADAYHHLAIAPMLVYLLVTLLPVIYFNGKWVEKIAAASFVLLLEGLIYFDIKTGRIDQRLCLKRRGFMFPK